MPTSPGAATAANVRAELARQNLSQRQAARRLGWSQQVLNNRLRGHSVLSVDHVVALAALLDVPITDLIPACEQQLAGASEALAVVGS